MNILNTPIDGLKILEPKIFQDLRGRFVKTFNKENGLKIEIKESYYSISHKDVIRGMHFQIPPYDHIKLVYVPNGAIIDVVLDIRRDSPTYKKFFKIKLSAENGKVLIIPKGLAHGFKSLQDNTIAVYMQTTCYSPEHDEGIRFDSFGFDWECDNPKVSSRDLSFKALDEFDSPFIYGDNK